MPRLTLIVLVISGLVVASTAVLYVRTQQAAGSLLVGRGVDRAAALAIAARATRVDDGVLARMAAGLVDETVTRALVFDPTGAPVRPPATPATAEEVTHGRRMVARVLDGGSSVTHHRGGFGQTEPIELWYPLAVGAPTMGAGSPVPGPHAGGPRVLLLVLEPASAAPLVRQTLVHAILITALLALLVVLTVRQGRLTARERRRELEHAAERRFSALGRLSAVLAHEVRNPLGAIKGFAQYTARRFDADDPARGDMDAIVAESTRLERLVDSLLLYARPRELQRELQDVRRVIERSLRLIEREAAERGVAVRPELGAEPALAEVDAEQLTQAMLNLTANAVEAMAEDGGELRVVLTSLGEAGLRVTVGDTGPGIDPEVLGEVFEPYVTRRAQGTGLGLAVVRRILRAHGGVVVVDSVPGQGTTFTMDLPRRGGGSA